MIRGFVYSFISVALFLACSIAWLTGNGAFEEGYPIAAGWVLLVCLFAVGPGFFMLGYWHSRKMTPDQPHWDPEMGE